MMTDEVLEISLIDSQITGEKDNGEGNSAFGVSHPSGRWAQVFDDISVCVSEL